MPESESTDPFERILQASNRNHLDNPFRTSDELRKRHFPGSGPKLAHAKLVKAYLVERDAPNPDWQLLAHGTWPWVIGHAHDLATLTETLEQTADSGTGSPIDGALRKTYVEKYSEAGTQEIEVFLNVYANAGSEFQKAVLEKLTEEAPQPPSTPPPVARSRASASRRRPVEPENTPSVDDLDPITRAKMSMVGGLFFLLLSLIPLGIQFWRQPDQDHWIVVSITGILAVLTTILTVDYLRKKP